MRKSLPKRLINARGTNRQEQQQASDMKNENDSWVSLPLIIMTYGETEGEREMDLFDLIVMTPLVHLLIIFFMRLLFFLSCRSFIHSETHCCAQTLKTSSIIIPKWIGEWSESLLMVVNP